MTTSHEIATVLVVDDDDDIRILMSLGLRRRGYRTLEATDGEEALRVIELEEIDVVLLDAGLPRLGGMEVLARLRADPRLATLPIIMVTGRGGVTDRVEGLAAGANDYVAKPVSLDELVARVEANLRGQRVWVDRLTAQLRARTDLATRLATTKSSFGDVTRHVVDTLCSVPTLGGTTIVRLHPSGSATTVATAVENGQLPLVLGPEIASALAALASGGASVLTTAPSSDRSDRAGPLVAVGLGAGNDHYALVVRIDPTVTDQRATTRETLGLLVELAPMIEHQLATSSTGDSVRAVANELLDVIQRGDFFPVFQPICDIDTAETVGYEALTRFDDGTPPDRRFGDALAVGLGHELERATLRAAMRDAAYLPAGRYVSINVSAALLGDPELASILDLADGRPLCIELTEHERITDYELVRAEFAQLGRNLRLSVDDAGSGWASLRHVFALLPDFVKLDRSWVSDIHLDPARQALLFGISKFVGELGGQVIAEGVELEEELATIQSLGINLAQGYYLGRPARVDNGSAPQNNPLV